MDNLDDSGELDDQTDARDDLDDEFQSSIDSTQAARVSFQTKSEGFQ